VPETEDVGVGHGHDAGTAVGLPEPVGDVADELVEVEPIAHQIGERRVRVAEGGDVRAAEAPEGVVHGVGLGPERLEERQPVGGVAGELGRVG
jgi:hypothetical protein